MGSEYGRVESAGVSGVALEVVTAGVGSRVAAEVPVEARLRINSKLLLNRHTKQANQGEDGESMESPLTRTLESVLNPIHRFLRWEAANTVRGSGRGVWE